jgi:hypothetical protein
MKYKNIREEELKLNVDYDYFKGFDCKKKIGNIDFCVCPLHPHGDFFEHQESLLWAEAKQGKSDIYNSIVQLILTIGRARTFDEYLPPPMLGAFDGEKIAFIPYSEIHDIFYQNDFNWNVTPSNYDTKEFKLVHSKVKGAIDSGALLFHFEKDAKELKKFIKTNFVAGKHELTKTRIDKNNFMVIYNKWLQAVKPTIAVNWDFATKTGIIDGDFYLADLLSSENQTIKEKLFVLLKHDHYELDREVDAAGMFSRKSAAFTDKQTAHTQFWNRYDRPPKEEYWDYITQRRDLLVPQDVRERKGSFFTPQIWVELSQKYLTDTLGEDWQDEYTIWDCAAGTGNLLNGLTNKYNIWASTLDQQDVDVMHDRIKNGANLLESHVFQFDFLNDDFSKLPAPLLEIINDPEKRKKMVIYINPPYAEADNRAGEGRSGVAVSRIHEKYSEQMGYARREMYIQFLTRIYCEVHGCMLADFSKIKQMQAPSFSTFRTFFRAKLLKCFLMPAKTFDNVKGNFPIGFKIWDTSQQENFEYILADLYNEKGENIGAKGLWAYDNSKFINDWIKPYRNTVSESIATIIGVGSDFQNQRLVRMGRPNMKVPADNHNWQITKDNLIESSIYFAVRHAIDATWLNDRDQFLYPNDGLKTDAEFQNNCLAFTLFSNNIQSQFGINHWIPFTEDEVNAREKFASNFMSKFISGKLKTEKSADLFGAKDKRTTPLTFSAEAQAVFDAGRELWAYYHQQPKCNVNASLYDIREHFQGRNEKGKMNNRSEDEAYSYLIKNLRDKLKILQKAIEPKIYEYGFLR